MKKRAFALITALCMTLTCFASAETVKHERVYAVTNAAGDALTVIDNVRLENGDALAEIDDRTLLTALENVGGTEKFTQSGETVTWKADGNSIIYQGTSDKALNVTPVVHMTLDGKEVTAADVKNASGELAMTVSYRAESPFLAVTVMPLSDDVTSVTVDNGAVLTDGAHSFLMGFGIPGADADLELPDSFTMTAHVDHADLNWMMTIATAQPVKVLTDALSDHAADAHTLVSDLTAGLNALADGSEIPESNEDIHELLTALNTLFDGAAQLKDGSITLLDGVKALKDGLDTLSSNSTALNDGAAQLFAAVLDTANTQLSAAGLDALSIEVPTLTVSNYAAVLDDLIAQLDPAVINKTIEALAKAQVREAVMAQEDKVREAVTEVVRGQVRDAVAAQEETIRAAVTDVVKEQVRQAVAAQEDTIRAAVTQAVQAQVQDAVQAQEDTIRAGVTQAVQAQVLEGVLAQAGLNMTAQQYQDAVAAGQVPDAQQKQISAAVDQMMASDDIKAKIEAAVTEQENQLVAQNMASDDIKAKIESAVTEQENQLIAQNMASGDIKAKIESAVAEQEDKLVEENFASADVQAKLEAAVTEQIDKLVEENYASADVQNTVREKKASIAAAVDSLKRLKEQLASVETFVNGLKAYTDGVAQAGNGASQLYDGANTLSGGMTELSDGLAELKAKLTEEGLDLLSGDVQKALDLFDNLESQMANVPSFDLVADGMAHDMLLIIRTDLQK